MDWRGPHRYIIVASVILAILLLGAAAVIYRNVDRLSRLEYENQRRFLLSAMLGFRRDFTGALLDLTRAFEMPVWTQTTEGLQRQLIERFRLLKEDGSDRELISQLSILVYSDGRPERFRRFESEKNVFVEEEVPESFLNMDSLRPFWPMPRPRRSGSKLEVLGDRLLLMIPHRDDQLGQRRPGVSIRDFPPPFSSRPMPPLDPRRWEGRETESSRMATFLVLIELDHDHFCEEILDRLQETYFRSPLIPGFETAITYASGNKIFYHSDRRLDSAFFSSADASVPLLGPGGWLFPLNLSVDSELSRNRVARQTGKLDLLARHRLGSLKLVIAKQRTYDLLEALGILLLLATAAVTLLVSVQKTRRLAKRQMDFIAGISHELRNPLTAIQSAGFNLLRGSVREDEKIRKYGQIISRESRRLIHVVEQVLSYAGIQQTGRQYHFETLRVEEILATVLQDYTSVFEEEGWEFTMEVEEGLPPLSADAKALESCLRNLIDNALKYAAAVKSLKVSVRKKLKSGRNWVLISVQDQGSGISSVDLPHIFDPFYRGVDHVASSSPGSGLGLAMVKYHVEAHGGKIEAFSRPGEGAELLLSFPALVETLESEEFCEARNDA